MQWLVIGTRQAYEMMPDFMRPTKLQCTVPHRFFIGMIVWYVCTMLLYLVPLFDLGP